MLPAAVGTFQPRPPALSRIDAGSRSRPDVKEVAKGYRADALKLKSVVNDKGENIGRIDDFIFGRDNGPVFVVLAVGDFGGLDGELVAAPFRSLKLDDPSGNIVLPGASRAALQKLPVFLYNH